MSWNNCLLFLLTGFLIFGCNRKCAKNTTANNQSVIVPPPLPVFTKELVANDTLELHTDTLLYYQRSACFGFCPTYNYIVYQNGMVRYNGIQHVDEMGTKFGLATDLWWSEVVKQINKLDFFNLEEIYPIEKQLYIPDLPNIIITIKLYGKGKTVIDNHHAPKELKDFEAFLEEHFQKIEFRKNW